MTYSLCWYFSVDSEEKKQDKKVRNEKLIKIKMLSHIIGLILGRKCVDNSDSLPNLNVIM